MRSLLAAAFLLWVSTLACASVIRMESRVDTSIHGLMLRAHVTVTNRGDEAAHAVQLKTELAGAAQTSPLQSILPVGNSYAADFQLSVQRLPPGRYPLILHILYADANGYPFSIVTVAPFELRAAPVPQVLGLLGNAAIHRRGRVTLKLKNLDAQEKRLRVRLLLPQELSADSSSLDLTLRPDQETRTAFAIRNFSALAGSTYPLFAIIEYDLAGLHHTAIASGLVQIGSGHSFLTQQSVFLAGAIASLIVLLLLNVRRHRKRP
ncbi:MAG: hypothetical protein A2992_01755 [Elusimicrobia bacterium RIFCSPLOWO2_01_FULL_59_12]|nr:MAG: hypothetical protein A2992_01755 [Elusimicrobia bacterium RIFCSPLOWO2_01_FULL_59_12]